MINFILSFQDVIRASTSQGHIEVHTKSENPYPNIAIHVKAEHGPKDVSYSDVIYPVKDPTQKEPGKVNDTNVDEDNDDDWDTFQSFPSNTAITENVDFSVLEKKVHHNRQNFDPHHVPDNEVNQTLDCLPSENEVMKSSIFQPDIDESTTFNAQVNHSHGNNHIRSADSQIGDDDIPKVSKSVKFQYEN